MPVNIVEVFCSQVSYLVHVAQDWECAVCSLVEFPGSSRFNGPYCGWTLESRLRPNWNIHASSTQISASPPSAIFTRSTQDTKWAFKLPFNFCWYFNSLNSDSRSFFQKFSTASVLPTQVLNALSIFINTHKNNQNYKKNTTIL